MSEQKIDPDIKNALRMHPCAEAQRGPSCLSDEALADYAASTIAGEKNDEEMVRHVSECDACFSKVAVTVSTLASFEEGPDEIIDNKSLKRAKSIPKMFKKTRGRFMKRNKYLLIAVLFFALSFISSRYFLQFLFAALIFGLKWVMDTGGSKALIMIYDTWQRHRGTQNKENSRF